MSSSDREVLLALCRATGGPHWRRKEGWDTNADISSWHRVTVRDGNVVGLDLYQNNLQGPIPKELGQLPSPEMLNFGFNNLNGSIPKELAALSKLMRLYLQCNQLTGSIPKELAALSELKVLYLQNNQLTGSIPKELAALSKLEWLFLDNNQLTGSIPKELAALSKLVMLSLSHNQLTGSIPEELAAFSKLVWLYLDNNQLTGTIPMELLNILTMREINCRGNSLSGDDGLAHSHLWRAVGSLTSLWHFLLPVLDDITDFWLLWETSGGSHRDLWWTCLFVFIIAEIERVYTAFFFLVFALCVIISIILSVPILCFLLVGVEPDWFDDVIKGFLIILSLLAMQKEEIDKPWWVVLDSLLWTLFGSRARSSPFMKLFGQAGQATGDELTESGFGLHGIDVILFFHPMRYFGEFLLTFPRGNRRPEVAIRKKAQRREMAMVRAVGETLCVDPMFLSLSVVTGGWDANLTGFAMVSALFSMLELVTELQYYVTEAEAATPAVRSTSGNDVEIDMGRSASAIGSAVGNDIEGGFGGGGNRGTQPIEIGSPVQIP